MQKATKGAVAAAGAAALLLGGAGSLAYWTASQDAGTAAIASGKLTLSTPDCATNPGTHGWQLDNGDAYNPGVTLLVPGDSISKICDMDLELEGDHIGATIEMDAASITGDPDLDAELTPSAAFLVDGVAYAPITDAGSYVVRATVSVLFKTTATSVGSQSATAALDAINVTATQTHDIV